MKGFAHTIRKGMLAIYSVLLFMITLDILLSADGRYLFAFALPFYVPLIIWLGLKAVKVTMKINAQNDHDQTGSDAK
ncbi:MAG: hypothetical protein FWE07_06890 [Turicibacter sp.]|nr:hypothetical protein [Turicibacter sp.]